MVSRNLFSIIFGINVVDRITVCDWDSSRTKITVDVHIVHRFYHNFVFLPEKWSNFLTQSKLNHLPMEHLFPQRHEFQEADAFSVSVIGHISEASLHDFGIEYFIFLTLILNRNLWNLRKYVRWTFIPCFPITLRLLDFLHVRFYSHWTFTQKVKY